MAKQTYLPLLEKIIEPEKEIIEKEESELIQIGKEKGYLSISRDSGKVKYLACGYEDDYSDPEEKVRAAFYVELIEKYGYPRERINVEVEVPRREPKDRADIVIYEDDVCKQSYGVVECKKEGMPDAEIEQALKQVWGNANNLRAKYGMLVAGNLRIAFDAEKFEHQTRQGIIADLPARYSKPPKFLFRKGDAERDLKPVTQSELDAKFQQCHDILWEGGRRNPAEAFDEMSKLMFCKLQDERVGTEMGEYYHFQCGTNEEVSEVVGRVNDIYAEARRTAPNIFQTSIRSSPGQIYRIVEILQSISLNKTDLDAKGKAFENFLGVVFRGEMGQYFTDRRIVEFVVDMLEPTQKDKVIDPTCGSGGFLLYALDRVRRYAEARFNKADAYAYWYNWALTSLHGIEINEQISRIAMMGMIIHEDGHTNIKCADALEPYEVLNSMKDKITIEPSAYTLIMTNPPFGAVVSRARKGDEHPYLDTYKLGGKIKKRDSQKTEILFIERCLDLLEPGGRMGIVLPDGILTNSTLQYVRDFIIEMAQILAVVSLPQQAFIPYGSGVKSSLLFLRKWRKDETPKTDYDIFMAIAEHIGYDATGRDDANELPDILDAYREFKRGKRDFFGDAPLCFWVGRGDVIKRLDPAYYKPEHHTTDAILQSSQYKVAKLSDYLERVMHPPEFKREYVKHGLIYLRSQNVRPYQLDFADRVFVNPARYKSLPEAKPKPGDLLFVRSGVNVGDCAYVREELPNAVYSADILVCKLKANLSPAYAAMFFNSNLGRRLLKRDVTGATNKHITSETLRNAWIVIPPRLIQDAIAAQMEAAYQRKSELEEESQSLLDSIDGYLIEQLGIQSPDLTEEKIFSVTARMVRGGRFDPLFYSSKFAHVEMAIQRGKYHVVKLSSLLASLESGSRPQGGVQQSIEGVMSIGGEHILPTGEINYDEMKFVSLEFHKQHPKSMIQPKDILIVKDGATTGKVAFVPPGERCVGHNINEHIFKLTTTGDVLPEYLFAILFSRLGQTQLQRQITGSAQKGITRQIFDSVLIPLPPMEQQEAIAIKIQCYREQAKALRMEAQETVIKAKAEVERMILGEKDCAGG